MSPIWMEKTIEQMSQTELRATLNDPRASEALRDDAGNRLGKLQEASRYDARVRRAKKIYRETQQHSPKGSIDPRNLAYAAKRSGWTIGGVWGAMSAGMASYQFWADALGMPPAQDILRAYPVLTIASCLFGASAAVVYGAFVLDEKSQSHQRRGIKKR